MHSDRQAMVPPPELNIQFGAGDYLAVGDRMCALFKEKFGLRPEHKVLDVGCGAGRVAVGLTDHLVPPGEYHGFDTFPFGIEWCNERIAPRYPHFHFSVSDVYNNLYNPFAKTKAREYVFPFEDGYFDLVVLKSVFTHMYPDDMMHYTGEIARVLRPGGGAVITFFLLNDESRALQKRTGQGPKFKKFGLFYTENPADPMDCVGYEETLVRHMFEKNGLAVADVLRGDWCGRPGDELQDFVLLEKPAAPAKP
ncbi:class I SAM-dependent methyltransferase [Desulfocurvus sp. DL9XJH121]